MTSPAIPLLLALSMIAFAGCLQGDQAGTGGDGTDGGGAETVVTDSDPLSVLVNASYEAYVVTPAVHQGHGLYEPTIDVSQEGTIYISSHSTGVGAGPSPSYVSTDDGATWQPMAFAADQTTPAPQGAAPLFSDEIFIVAGDDGQAWGVDINLRDYIIAGWCAEGTELCYYNPNAYDHALIVTQAAECQPVALKDRPWAAYSNGRLLVVNNPGGGPAQIGAMTVPPEAPADAAGAQSDIQWNLCATSGGFIPGIPDLREDGFFAVPQLQDGDGDGEYDRYIVTTGNAGDIMATEEHVVFDNTHAAPAESDSTPSEIGLYGQAVFDADGALFVGAMNNSFTAEEGSVTITGGGIHVAVSTDDAASFAESTFRFDQPASSIYLDGNKNGPGALLNWGLIDGDHTDWYMGYLIIGDDGRPRIKDVTLAFDDGPEASRHVQGAALGPDGRAYMIMSDVSGNDDVAMAEAAGSTPLRVVVQQDGPAYGASR